MKRGPFLNLSLFKLIVKLYRFSAHAPAYSTPILFFLMIQEECTGFPRFSSHKPVFEIVASPLNFLSLARNFVSRAGPLIKTFLPRRVVTAPRIRIAAGYPVGPVTMLSI